MNLKYYFCENEKPKVEVSQPVRFGYLIRYAFSLEENKLYFNNLNKLPWSVQEIVVAGKKYMPKRETLGFADSENDNLLQNRSSKSITFPYTFYDLRGKIRKIIMENINELEKPPEMNYCWGNKYRNGYDKVGKHKDNEKNHSKIDPIVSVSFGAYRFFDIYNENRRIERINLGFGDIFLMMPGFQQKYYHGVPQQKKIKNSRINLTFRTIIPASQNDNKCK